MIINVNGSGELESYYDSYGTFVLIVNTTVGYFEFPNYSNGVIAGPFLAQDPTVLRN